jgi:hypothetical protein
MICERLTSNTISSQQSCDLSNYINFRQDRICLFSAAGRASQMPPAGQDLML